MTQPIFTGFMAKKNPTKAIQVGIKTLVFYVPGF